MRKLRIYWSRIWLPIVLTLLAVASIGAALWIYRVYPGEQLTKVREEIAKSLMNLGAGVIVGGLVKILLDNFRNEQERSAARKAWAQDLLNRLRGVFDEIELSQTIPPQLSLVWNEFEKLPVLQDFLAAADSRYYHLFLDHYEYCKALLKSAGKARQWPEVRPPNFKESYLSELKNIDQKKRDEQLQASDSLLLKILEEHME